MAIERLFWKEKKLAEMTRDEWESLCDGCGLCCLHKLEDEDSGDVSYTNVACRLLDLESCKCMNYQRRKKLVPDCVVLKVDHLSKFKWLPPTCAYRLLSEGKDLFDWHPLISKNARSVHDAGISVAGKVISEREAGDMEDHLVSLEALYDG